MSSKIGIDELRAIERQFDRESSSINDRQPLEEIRNRYLSRKSGLLTLQFQNLGKLPKEQRGEFGRVANEIKSKFEAALEILQASIAEREKHAALEREALDTTLPGNRRRIGHRHPLTIVRREIEDIFISMGYTVEDGPEVESAYYNFDALNIPAGHPARDPRDTFYVAENVLLRTHTSPVQVRTMEKMKPPVRIICPGRVFRRDAFDPTHSPMFHQVECLAVAEGIRFSDLKGTLEAFLQELFSTQTGVRLRPSFFPFTEPTLREPSSDSISASSVKRRRLASGRVSFRSSNRARKSMCLALFAMAQAAAFAKEPAGLRSWARGWCIPTFTVSWTTMWKSTPDSRLAAVSNGTRC